MDKKNDANPGKLSTSPSKAMNNNMNMSNSVSSSPLNASPSDKFKKVSRSFLLLMLFIYSIVSFVMTCYFFFLQGLVDYEGDSDDEDEDEGNGDLLTPVHKRARLS